MMDGGLFSLEDIARNRKDHGPANITILRRRAPELARRDTAAATPPGDRSRSNRSAQGGTKHFFSAFSINQPPSRPNAISLTAMGERENGARKEF
jgi:hypothetical protein